jgi:hypothetical protein
MSAPSHPPGPFPSLVLQGARPAGSVRVCKIFRKQLILGSLYEVRQTIMTLITVTNIKLKKTVENQALLYTDDGIIGVAYYYGALTPVTRLSGSEALTSGYNPGPRAGSALK